MTGKQYDPTNGTLSPGDLILYHKPVKPLSGVAPSVASAAFPKVYFFGNTTVWLSPGFGVSIEHRKASAIAKWDFNFRHDFTSLGGVAKRLDPLLPPGDYDPTNGIVCETGLYSVKPGAAPVGK